MCQYPEAILVNSDRIALPKYRTFGIFSNASPVVSRLAFA